MTGPTTHSMPSTGHALRTAALLLALPLAVACTSSRPAAAPAPPPGPAAGEHAGHGAAAPAAAAGGARPSADAQFLQHMIPHHAQALVMTSLVPARTERPEIRLMAERIAVSQRDEIAQMRSWLEARGAPVPPIETAPVAAGGHAAHGGAGAASDAAAHASMPGMLSHADLGRLREARGLAFDRLFLDYMIRHHQGAITMVQQLFAGGGGQESQMYAVASEIESDQRMEIARMERLLATLPSAAPGR